MVPFKADVFIKDIPKILLAMPLTLLLTLSALVLGLVIGAVLCAASMGKSRTLSKIAGGYIAFMRGLPQLVLIFLLYLGLPQFFKNFGIDLTDIPKTVYLVGIFSLAISAPISEMMRSAYLAVDKGQREGAYSVGMSSLQAFVRIILPQAFGIAIPSLGNNIVMLFKMTSLGFTIGIVDIMGRARLIAYQGLGSRRLEAYLAVALIYWGFCVLLEQLNRILLKAYNAKGHKR
ncbi:MAG: amino acid ABC transporter permease [Spirochaetaceae bacterium]|jgi:L-cystine transport system permease protein|nr:amino acid ABC transporter permease [Spirochaetaceae bacterium]